MSANYNGDVAVIVEAAFGFDPLATPTWTDISKYARGFTTARGRSRVLDRVQAGNATVTLDNRDARFDPNNTAGAYTPNVRVFTPIRFCAVHSATTYDLWRGFVVGWPQTFPSMAQDAIVEVRCIDAFRLFAMFEAELTESQEFSGTRIGNLLDTAGWPAGWRDIDTGTHNVQALSAEFDSVLGQIQRAELVEQGFFHIAGNGDATYRDSNARFEDFSAVAATFSDDGADNEYHGVSIDYDDSQLWNTATTTRAGGTPQTSTDATSVGDFGERTLHLSETLHVADGEASALSDWLVSEFKDIRPRARALVVKPEGDPANLWPQVLGLELQEKLNLERDTAGDTFDDDFHIEGISHAVSMSDRRWVTTFQLSPKLQHTDFWILGTSELDTETRLGY